jgi:hypothetical protein
MRVRQPADRLEHPVKLGVRRRVRRRAESLEPLATLDHDDRNVAGCQIAVDNAISA